MSVLTCVCVCECGLAVGFLHCASKLVRRVSAEDRGIYKKRKMCVLSLAFFIQNKLIPLLLLLLWFIVFLAVFVTKFQCKNL